MNEQLLKDFIATAQKYSYDWNTVFEKFPELKGYDQQVLKDYVATAEENNYNYNVVNPKFPELGFQPSAPQQEEVKKKDLSVTTALPSEGSSLDLQSQQDNKLSPQALSDLKAAWERAQGKTPTAQPQPQPQPQQQQQPVTEQQPVAEQQPIETFQGFTPEQKKQMEESMATQSYMGGTAPLQPVKKSEKKTYVENLGTNLMSGLNQLNEMIASVPESVYDVFSIPQNALAYATGWDISTNSDKFKKTLGVENPILDYYKEEGKKLETEIQKFNEENYKSSSIYENIKDGNYGDAFELLGSGIVNSAPVSVAMMLGGATLSPMELTAAGTVGFYGQNQEQLQEENPNASDIENNIKALTMSAAETVFSAVGEGQIGAVYRDIIKKEGVEAGAQVFKSGILDMYKQAIKKYGIPVGLLGEGLEEATTQITQNMISGKPAFEGAADAFILGGGSGVAFTAPISLKNAKDRLTNEVAKIDDKKQINAILSNNESKLHTLFDVSKDDAINESQFKIASLGKSRDLLVKNLKENVRKGVITQDQANQSLYVFDKTQQVAGQLRDVNIDEPSKVKVANLLKERDALTEKMQGKDEALSVLEKERIGQINEEIKKTIIDSNAKSQAATPSYSINGKEMSEQDFTKAVSEMSPEDVKKADIKANNATEGVTTLLKEVAIRSGVESAPMMETTAPAEAPAAPEAQPAKPKTLDEIEDEDLKSTLNFSKEYLENDLKLDEEDYNKAKENFDSKNPIVRFFSKKPSYEQYTQYTKNKLELLKNNPEQYISDAVKEYEESKKEYEKDGEEFPQRKQETLDYLKNQLSKLQEENAIQKPTTEESVLRTKQPEVELPTMGEGNAQETTTQEGVAPAKPQEVKPKAGSVGVGGKVKFIEKEIPIDKIQPVNKDGQTLADAKINVADKMGSRTEGKILVYENADGTYEVGDGFHRIAEAISRGDKTIKADVKLQSLAETPKPQAKPTEAKLEVDELLDLDVKSEDNLLKVYDFLDKIDNDLKSFGEETLGMNVSVVAARGIVKTIKALVKGGMLLRDAIKKVAADNNMSEEEVSKILNTKEKVTAFNEGIKYVQDAANEYKQTFDTKERRNKVQHSPVTKLFTKISKAVSDAYDNTAHKPKNKKVKEAYDAMIRETIDQYKFIISKGLNVERHTGKGEPYADSKEMLDDIRNNKTLKFLPNDVAFGQGTTAASDNIGLQPSGIKLKDGYELTNSEVFRIVHDYFGHGILGNQFGSVGEENATLQHLDLYSDVAAPAVIFQTRGQNSWVNFSGKNKEATELRKQAKELQKQGKKAEAKKLLDKANKLFKFAEPKIALLPNKLNFRRYETARRIENEEGINSRADKRADELSSTLETNSERSRRTRGVDKRDIRRVERIRGNDVNVVAEYTLDDKINQGILKAFPTFNGVQKIYEITNGDVYQKLLIQSLDKHPFAASVTVHSPENFNGMRMFITEDGSTGITLTKEGFLGGAFSLPEKPNNLAQLMVLGIKEGATTAECFDTILPDYYANFGFKAVSRTAFNDEFKPMVENGNTVKDWDYETYKKFNNGRPDVVFLVYDGGDRNTIEDRIGQFDLYKNYEKENTKSFDKNGYDSAEAIMKQMAIKTIEFYEEQESTTPTEKTKIDELLTLDTKDKTNLQKVFDFLDKADKDLTKFSKETLGVNIAIPVMKAIVKSLKVLVKGGMTLQEAITKVAKDNKVSFDDVVAGMKTLAETVSEEALSGYDRMMAQVDNIIEKGLNRGTNQKDILNNVISYIQGSKAYENATAQQQEEIIRDVKKAFGEKIKPAPSAKKILGFLKDIKKVTMDEMSLLKQRLKDMAKGAKTAESAINKASRNLTESLKDLVKKGDITTKQMLTVLRKFSKTNLLDDASVDKFVNYMTKVFADAEYADKISKAYTQLKVAQKNIKTKIGIAEDLHPLLRKIFSVNPNLIPDAVFEKYLGLVDMFGQKKQVLKLDNKQDVVNLSNEIIDAIDEELSLSEELADRFSNYADKVVDANGKVDYAATIQAMVKDDTITEDEAKIMRKYKSKIFPSAKPTPKTDAELAQEKQDLLTALNGVDIDTENLPTHDEREVARKLDRLIRSDAVNNMTNEQLTNLLKVIDNINNGYLPHYSQLMLERLNALNNGSDLKNAIDKAKPLSLSKIYANLKSIFTRKDAISEMVRRNPLYYIDQVFGNFKSKDIFNSLFKATSEAETLFKSNITAIQNKLDNAQEAVAKSFSNNPNKTMMSKFKMMTYMIQLEYQSNPNSKQVNPASEYLKATIKHIDEGKSSFGERDADMLQKVLDEYSDANGDIDIDKLYNSFNAAEKKTIATIKEVNESLREKAMHTSAIIRGDKINPLDNYVHLNVLHDAQPDDAISGVSSAEAYNNSLRPSTKAKSLIARTGKVAPLNFDVFASAQRGAKFLLMDYYLTEPIRTARKTINEATAMMEKDGRIPKEKRQILNAISNAFEETTENVLNNVFVTNSFADDVVNYMSKSGYRAVLASVPRFISELTSNVGFALFTDPKALATGHKYRDVVMSSDAVKILNNVGSKQTNRIFPHETLAGRLIDTSIMSQASGIKGGRAKSDVANVIQMLYNNSLKKYKNSVETLADALISTPDKMVMRPMWIGSFANEFKKITGRDIDFDKIANNDEAYMLDNKDAIDDARDVADQRSVLTGATENPYMDMLKGKVKPNQSALARGFNMFNNYMTKFTVYEYTTARTGIMAAMGNGSLSRKQGVALLAGVTTRMVLYTLLAQTLGSGMVGLFVDDEDDEDEKSLGKKFGQALTSTFTSLLVGRDFGNATKTIVNYGLERVNENYLDALREGDYDPYKDAIQYSIVPPDVKGKKTTLTDYITNMGGPFAPTLKTADLIARKLSEEPKKKQEAIERSENEVGIRIPLEILGNVGLVPLYKDIRKITMKNIYKDLEKAQKTAGEKEEDIKPYGLNKEELKRYMPDVYEKYYGEETNYAKDRNTKSKIRKKKDELRRKMLDERYNYISPKEKGFGSSDFGQGTETKTKSKKDSFGSAEFGSK